MQNEKLKAGMGIHSVLNHDTIFIIGESRTNSENAITKIYGSFFIAFEVNVQNGVILDANCTHILDLTEQFLRRIFVGKSLENQCDQMEEEISRRYYGSSTRAIIASLRDAGKKYAMAKAKLKSI